MNKTRHAFDQPNSFGWISIALHWFSAIALTLLWFIGQSIASLPAEEINARRSLHITLGLIIWLPLLARIYWRIRSSHPRVEGQGLNTHRVAKAAHYVMLAVLAVLMLSGPLLAWALPDRTGLADFAFTFHSNAAKAMAALVILHILAALKHLMFNDDETIARIFIPRTERSETEEI